MNESTSSLQKQLAQRNYEGAVLRKQRAEAIKKVKERIKEIGYQLLGWCNKNQELLSEVHTDHGLNQLSHAEKPHYVYPTTNASMETVRFTLKGQAIVICYLNCNKHPITLNMIADMVSALMIPLRERLFNPLFNFSPEIADALLKDPKLAPLVDILNESINALKLGGMLDNEERRQRSDNRLSLRTLKGQVEQTVEALQQQITVQFECLKDQTEQSIAQITRAAVAALAQVAKEPAVKGTEIEVVKTSDLSPGGPPDNAGGGAVLEAPESGSEEKEWTEAERLAEYARCGLDANGYPITPAAAAAAPELAEGPAAKTCGCYLFEVCLQCRPDLYAKGPDVGVASAPAAEGVEIKAAEAPAPPIRDGAEGWV